MAGAKKGQPVAQAMQLTVRAAGGGIVRPDRAGEVELAIVHRSASGDWTRRRVMKPA
jgi:hypothetical protein